MKYVINQYMVELCISLVSNQYAVLTILIICNFSDLQDNLLSGIEGELNPPPNVTLRFDSAHCYETLNYK